MFNLAPSGNAVRPYVVAGPGAYYRKVEITEYVGSGVICDPWYYVCGIVSGRRGARIARRLGLRVQRRRRRRVQDRRVAEFFVETRYHYVAGPEIVSATPLPRDAGRRNFAHRAASPGSQRASYRGPLGPSPRGFTGWSGDPACTHARMRRRCRQLDRDSDDHRA